MNFSIETLFEVIFYLVFVLMSAIAGMFWYWLRDLKQQVSRLRHRVGNLEQTNAGDMLKHSIEESRYLREEVKQLTTYFKAQIEMQKVLDKRK